MSQNITQIVKKKILLIIANGEKREAKTEGRKANIRGR